MVLSIEYLIKSADFKVQCLTFIELCPFVEERDAFPSESDAAWGIGDMCVYVKY